jgi:hypothetical protein
MYTFYFFLDLCYASMQFFASDLNYECSFIYV